jgi:hypothetical protein
MTLIDFINDVNDHSLLKFDRIYIMLDEETPLYLSNLQKCLAKHSIKESVVALDSYSLEDEYNQFDNYDEYVFPFFGELSNVNDWN